MNNSKKALQAAFRDATFDPRKPGTLSTIASSNDPDYLVKRVEEILRDSARFDGAEKWTRVRDAIGILGYSLTLLPKPPYELVTDRETIKLIDESIAKGNA